jgi:hypothetical protein
MDLQKKVARTSNVAVFCRNYPELLEHAAKIGAEIPEQLITFRANTVWKSAKAAVDVHGPRKIYFVPVEGQGLVQYEATLDKVVLYPDPSARETQELLNNCLPETREEGLWEQYSGLRTLYVISHCRRLPVPFAYTLLRKLSDRLPISEGYGYSYSVVYEYCPECGGSPCRCAK